MAVDWTELASFIIAPFVPDVNVLRLQRLLVGVTADEPQQFLDYASRKHLLGCDQREAFAEVESHLMSENADCACARAVFLSGSFGQDSSFKV